jgi:uncharacterized protein involved in exopolysaccharide biosynthesis
MASPASLPPAPDADSTEGEPADGVDFARMVAIARFVLRAPRRRPRLAASVLLLGLLTTVAVAVCAPRVYAVTTKILVQRNVVIPLLGNPRRPLPADWDVPTRGTSETILRRDNLVAIIKETNLTERGNVGRSPLSMGLEWVARAVLGPVSEEDKQRALVGALEKKLGVQADETTITISFSWHDPKVAYQIISCVERNFLRERGENDTAAITETIAILETEAARQREAIDAGLVGAQKIQQAVASAGPPGSALRSPRWATAERGLRAASAGGAASTTTTSVDLAQKRAAIQALEDPWQRRLIDLKAQLATVRLTYASAHPSVMVLEEKIRQASVEPPELTTLKGEEHRLLAQIKGVAPGDTRLGTASSASLAAVAAVADLNDSPELIAAKARLIAAVQKYEELRDRIDSARLEINTAQAAFKFRYSVVVPVDMPKSPTKPNFPMIGLGGLALSIVLAFAAAGAKDRASDLFLEAWQVQQLPIPLLAEVKDAMIKDAMIKDAKGSGARAPGPLNTPGGRG